MKVTIGQAGYDGEVAAVDHFGSRAGVLANVVIVTDRGQFPALDREGRSSRQGRIECSDRRVVDDQISRQLGSPWRAMPK